MIFTPVQQRLEDLGFLQLTVCPHRIASALIAILFFGSSDDQPTMSDEIILYDLPSKGGHSWSVNPWKSKLD